MKWIPAFSCAISNLFTSKFISCRLLLCTWTSAFCHHFWFVAGEVHHEAVVRHQSDVYGYCGLWMYRYLFILFFPKPSWLQKLVGSDCPSSRLTLCCQPFPAITVFHPIASPVQQSSFYGYMGMLPKRYTQGVMTGESKRFFAIRCGHENPWCLGKMQKQDSHSLFFFCIGTAGVIISLSRIFTKLLIKNERKNTIIFFVISICMVLLCFVLHVLVRRTRFVQYYMGLARQGLSQAKDHSQNGTQYQVHHDVITEEVRFVSFACQMWEGHIIMNLFTAFLQ